MDSTRATADTSSASSTDRPPRTIVLHILSPSLETPNRLTFDNLPLTTTVGALKTRITESIPSRPSAAQQRLIYRGKPLLNDSMRLQNFLEPSEDSVHTLHLVLPPRPVPHTTPNASADAGSGLPGESPTIPGTTNQNIPPPANFIQGTQSIRFRATLNQPASSTPPVPGESDITGATAALRRNIESLRRQLELQTQARRQQQQQYQSVFATGRATGLPHSPQIPPSSRPVAPPRPASANGFREAPAGVLLSVPVPPSSTRVQSLAANSSPMLGSPANAIPSLQSLEMETRRLRLFSLQQLIGVFESQIARGIPPQIESVISVRNQLYSIIDDQYRNPAALRDSQTEALLSRVLNVYIRTDQLRVLQSRRPVAFQADGVNSTAVNPTAVYGPYYPLYMLASPAGYQAVLVSPTGLATMQPPPFSLLPQQTPGMPVPAGTRQQDVAAPVAPPNPIQPAMENVVRQAVLNRAVVQDNQEDIVARNTRRVWLFIRLYFFCYLFSDSGTWSRFIFVSIAILISFLSETGLPRRLHGAVINPVQRHLDGLIHGGNNGNEANPRVNGDAPPAAPANRQPQASIIPTEMQQVLRRVERAVALFVASLVPGVGERQVEVRNAAAEAAARNAERAREEEQQRRDNAEQRVVEESSGTTATTVSRGPEETPEGPPAVAQNGNSNSATTGTTTTSDTQG